MRESGRTAYADPLLAALALVGVAILLWFLAGPGGAGVSWTVQAGLDVLVAVFGFRLARATAGDRHARRFWLAVGLSGVSCAIGDTFQTLFGDSHRPSPVQTGFVVVGMVGVMLTMLFHPLGGTGRQRLRLWLDAATVLAAVAVFLWYFVVADALTDGNRADLIGAAATSGVMLLITVGLLKLILGGTAPFARGPGLIAALGVAGTAIAATTVTLLTSDPGAVYVAQLLPCLLIPISQRLQELQSRRAAGTGRTRRRRASRLPYLAVAAVQLLLLGALVGRNADLRVWGVTAGAVLITGIVLARQGAAFTDNERLLGEVDRQREWFRSLVQHASDLTMVVCADGTLTFATPAARQVLGIDADALAGTPLTALVAADDRPLLGELIGRLAAAPGTDADAQLRFRHADGSYRVLHVVGVDLTGNPSVGGVVLNARDVTEERALHEELQHRAHHDALTGLANRALLEKRIAELAPDAPVSVLLVDLDGFKPINDEHGHHAGDQVLITVAQRLRSLTGATGLPARLGGDEFAVLLPGAGAEAAGELSGRLAAALSEPVRVPAGHVSVGASIGSATGPAARAGDLLREADAAMYRTKATRKAGALVG